MAVVAEFRDRAAEVEVVLLNLQFAGDEDEAEGEEGLCDGIPIPVLTREGAGLLPPHLSMSLSLSLSSIATFARDDSAGSRSSHRHRGGRCRQ